MKWVVVLMCVAVAGGVGAAEKVEPAAPKKPVEISAQVASFAARKGKCEVTLQCTLKKEGTTYVVEIHGQHWTRVPLKDVKAIAAALEKLADGMKPGPDTVVGDVKMRVMQLSGADAEKVLVFSDSNPFASSEYFDADQASELAKALLRAEGVAAWVAPRIDAFQK